MIVRSFDEVKEIPVSQLEYKGESIDVDGVTIRWLTHNAIGDESYLHNFAVRYFTMAPGSEIPIHGHKYVEAVFILKGDILFTSGGEEKTVKPYDTIYVPSFEEHALVNIGDTEAAFICCIDCHGDKANCLPGKKTNKC